MVGRHTFEGHLFDAHQKLALLSSEVKVQEEPLWAGLVPPEAALRQLAMNDGAPNKSKGVLYSLVGNNSSPLPEFAENNGVLFCLLLARGRFQQLLGLS